VKIYTRKGDRGDTSLFGGKRVPKDDPRVGAYGIVDELNSVMGIAIAGLPEELRDWTGRLLALQSDCFTIGAVLATPKTGESKPAHIPDLSDSRVSDLESWIDELDDELEPLQAFILPGGSVAAAAFHHARTVCRRAERAVVGLQRHESLDPTVLKYLNRLSDLLFTLARAANARLGIEDAKWRQDGAEAE
jgi:cob(I)alamin adenosyltransferase